MEVNKIKSITDKVANVMIVSLVVAGTAAFVLVNRAPEGGEVMSKLFLVFFGAIISTQIVPGLLLLGVMLKGLFSLARKDENPLEVTTDPSNKK